MTRYIDADALIEKYIVVIRKDADEKLKTEIAVLLKDIEEQPTIDAEPVRHGKWADDAMGVLRCSECNAQAPWRFVGRGYNEVDYRWKSDYCPNCGARMDKE